MDEDEEGGGGRMRKGQMRGGRRRRRRSAPDALSVKSMETWIKQELNSAEFIPFPNKKTQQKQQQFRVNYLGVEGMGFIAFE
jgi:hypothetical protein